MIISLIFVGISALVSMRLRSKFQKYSEVPTSSGLTGREIAEKMLKDNGIYDVKVVSAQGFLSDHYNPANKTVNLSPDVYNNASVAAAAVAAHECAGTRFSMPRGIPGCSSGPKWCRRCRSAPISCRSY